MAGWVGIKYNMQRRIRMCKEKAVADGAWGWVLPYWEHCVVVVLMNGTGRGLLNGNRRHVMDRLC